jgi:phosphatidylglycerol:prolipoprotein diacylglycerol transferase
MRELFRIPIPGHPIPVWGYGLMLVIGFYCAMLLARALSRRSGIDPDTMVNAALIALIAGIVGARLSHILENLGEYTRPDLTFGQNLYNAINISSGGLTFYGGFILATVACITYGLMKRIPVRLGMDVIAPCVMIGLGFGRIGCYLNGCCYGAECNVPWAVSFPYHSNAYLDQYEKRELDVPAEFMTVNRDGAVVLKSPEQAAADPMTAATLKQKMPGRTVSLPVHPAQIYSAITAFMLAGILVAFFTLQPTPGRVFALMLLLEAPTRFLLEMLRAEPPVLGPMSFSMVLSIPLFVLGLVLWFAFGKMNPGRPKFEYDAPTATAGMTTTPAAAG